MGVWELIGVICALSNGTHLSARLAIYRNIIDTIRTTLNTFILDIHGGRTAYAGARCCDIAVNVFVGRYPILVVLTYTICGYQKFIEYRACHCTTPRYTCVIGFSLNKMVHWPYSHGPHLIQGYFPTRVICRTFMLCNWLSLWCLVPLINYERPTLCELFENCALDNMCDAISK